MNLFSNSPVELADQQANARMNPLKAGDLNAGFFSGLPTAGAMAVGSIVNDAALPVSDAVTPALLPAARRVDSLFKTDVSGWLENENKLVHDAVTNWTPDPTTVGWLGRQLYGAANVLGDVAVGTMATGSPVAGVSYASTAQGYKAFTQAQSQGLNTGTSLGMGGITAGATFLGAFIPIHATKGMATSLLGRAMGAEVAGNAATASALYGLAGATAVASQNVGAKVATAGAVQVLTGAGQRAATSELLQARGYSDMAKQYEPFDMAEMASDFAIGSLFGLGAHGLEKFMQGRQIPDPKPSDLAAVLALNNAAHIEVGSAPGIPTDPVTRQAHVEAMTKAITDLLAGEEVNVGDAVTRGAFIENPNGAATRAAVADAVAKHLDDFAGLRQELEQRGLPGDENLYNIDGPSEPRPPVRVTAEVGKLIDDARAEGLTNDQIVARLEDLKKRLDTRNAEAGIPNDRVRGALWVIERLTRAERNGELSSKEVALAKWLIDQNPNVVHDLALSIVGSKGDQVGGFYNPLARLARIFRGGSDSLTTVHEILHHTERMMPKEVRDGIHAAWKAEVDALERVATETGNADLMRAVGDIRKANVDGDVTPSQILQAKIAHENLISMVKDGLVSKDLYALVNRSEYWAVNASKLVRDRANAQGWVAKAVQWVKEFMEKAKDAFGMRSDAPIIRALDAVLKSDGSLSGGMLAEGREFANVEAPGEGVAQKNLNGFEPGLRVTVPLGKMELPAKPLILTGTDKKNAGRQVAAIDEILAKFPDADTSPLEWSKMMAYAMASDDVPVPPYRFLKDINSDGAVKSLSRLSAGQIADAQHGFENAAAFRDAYTAKQLDVETTGKLFMWSFLSRGVSPYTQEGLFIDGFKGAGEWIKKAADGNLTEADFPAYEEWAKSVAPQGSGQPGSGATHNLNAFGKLFLFKMGQRDASGMSLLQTMHNMMEDPNMTGKDLRRWFIQNTEGVGIDNKVVSFTLLVAGFKDLMVLDRVQIRQLWDDGRFGDRNLYDGRKVDGKPVSGSMLSEITYGARGLLIYEAIERALAKRIENIYTALGRPEDGSIGRYHWETWVADSEQEASHGTLDAILHDAQGNPDMIAQVTAKEGEYGAYAYGARYGRDATGTPYFMYGVKGMPEYRFSVGAFREFLAAVKSPANGVVPTKFKVTEAGNAPWYERAEVNKQALDELAKRYAGEPGQGEGAGAVPADGQGQAVPDRAGRPASDPYSPESLIGSNPALTIIGPDGTMVSAGRALTMADAEIASMKQESQGYDAAAACALRG